MGQPAARALIDIGAHVGLIMTGSINVFIGGGMAARKGDAITCALHGVASIVGGSSSVFINGMPAARMGDPTSCGTSPMPPMLGPTQAPDKISHATPASDVNADGTIKTDYPDNLSIRALDAYAGLKDKTGDGNYDQAVAGFAITDFQAKGEWQPFGGEYGGVGGSVGFSVAKGDALVGTYGGNGIYGSELNASVSYLEGNAEVHIGKEGELYTSVGAEGTVLYAEAEAKRELYTGGSENRYGFYAGGGAGAGVAKGSITCEQETLFFDVKAHLDGDVGAVGGNAGLGFYIDTDDYIVNIKIELGIDIGIGAQGGLDISFKFKPIIDLFNSIFSPTPNTPAVEQGAIPNTPAVIPGVIITGCFTVLIG